MTLPPYRPIGEILHMSKTSLLALFEAAAKGDLGGSFI